MTDDRQAVKTLAEQLVKAMKSVSANTPSKYNNYSGAGPSTIQASKIVGLPAAFSSIISGVESSAAGGDAVAQQTLTALNHIAAGEFETITADTANIEKIYATFGDFITLVAGDAQIGHLDVETIRAGLAEVGLLNIGTASIDMAQIKRSSTQTAFIYESVQGKVYIDDLAVNDASIVNLAAGTVLINDNSGNLVELYVDDDGDVSTRAVSYDGDDVIKRVQVVDEHGDPVYDEHGNPVYDGTLHGNRIVQNSITTDQLNANEIFAAQGTIMDLIADNIEATRLFANQGFIAELQSTIISSDLSENSTIIELTDSINLFASNTSRTFIQDYMPIPTHTSDTWFDPSTEEHYVANSIYLPISQMIFGHDDGGCLYNDHSEDYTFSMNSDGELMLLVTNEEAGTIILENDINFEIVNDRVFADGLWKKVDNIAFSRLKVSVDGIISDVYDSITGESRIEQNAGRIVAIVTGDTSVPHVKTSSIEIENDKVEIKSTGNVDIKASNFSISFNTAGNLANKSRVDISNNDGIKVSDSYGNYFQAKSTNIGLYDIEGTPRLYIDNTGHAFFYGSLTLGGANNVNGSLTVRNGNGTAIIVADNVNGDTGIKINNDSGAKIGYLGHNGIEIYDKSGETCQFYIDNETGNATFAGDLNAVKGSINGATVTLGGQNNTSGVLTVNNANNTPIVNIDKDGISIYKGNTRQFYIDSLTGDVTFSGNLDAAGGTFSGTMSAACITSGTLSADRIAANSIAVAKLSGSIQNGGWNIDLDHGTLTIGNISATKITSDTMSADRISGGTLTLGGTNDTNGKIVVRNAGGQIVAYLDKDGISMYNNGTKQLYIDNQTGDATFAGVLNAAGGTFSGELSAATGTFAGAMSASCITSGTLSADRIAANSIAVSKLAGSIQNNGWDINLDEGTLTLGNISANNINAGTLSADRIAANSIAVAKLSGSIQNSGWDINLDDGTLTIGNISANKINSGTMSASRINGGTLTLGGANNGNGQLVVKNNSNKTVVKLDNTGITVQKGSNKKFYVNNDGDVIFTGELSGATGTFDGELNGVTGTFSGTVSITSQFHNTVISPSDGIKQTKSGYTTEIKAGVIKSFYNTTGGEYSMEFNPFTGLKTKIYSTGIGICVQNYSKDNERIQIGPAAIHGYYDNSSEEKQWLYLAKGRFTLSDVDFMTSGTKSRTVSTSQYSSRLLYCYETPSPLFGDVGEGQISSDGKCYIALDPIFAQTISTEQYQVFLQPYGDGACYISERHGSYFVVSGTPNLQFGWELKAKQSDFDQLRLERNDEKFSVPYQNYGEDAANHIKELYDERTQQDDQESEE